MRAVFDSARVSLLAELTPAVTPFSKPSLGAAAPARDD
jgi:hypothetical protein